MDWPTVIKGMALLGTVAFLLLGIPKTKEEVKDVGLHLAAVFASLLTAAVVMLVVMGS